MNTSDSMLDPPSFDLPSDYYENPSDYELWSLRAPIQFDVSHLNDQLLYIQNLEGSNRRKNSSRGSKATTIVKHDDILTSFQLENDESGGEDNTKRTYSLALCQPNETQSFRILAKKLKGDDNDNEEGGDDEKEMVPIPLTFTRNLTIVETTHSKVTDLDLAPSLDRAPRVDLEKQKMRIPYVPIDQKSGLKKRWSVFGSNTCINEDYVNVNEDKADDSTPTGPLNTANTATNQRKVSDDVVENNLSSPGKKKNKKSKKAKKQ